VEYVDGDEDRKKKVEPQTEKTPKAETGSIPIDSEDDNDDEDYSEGSGSGRTQHSSTTTSTTTTSTTTTRASITHTPKRKVYFLTDDEDLLEGSGSSEDLGSGSGDGQLTVLIASNKTSPRELEKVRGDFLAEHGVDILILDNSCVTQFSAAPKIQHATMQ
jgi:hypothetical protein